MGKNKLQVAILNAILLMGGTLAYPATTYAQNQAMTYRIDAGELESVISQFGTQSRIQLIYHPELMAGRRSVGLVGSYNPMEGLRQILDGSGLEAERVNDFTMVIRKSEAETTPPAQRVEQNTQQNAEPQRITDLDEIVVTGTSIRGFAPRSSPLEIFTRDDVLNSGASSIEEFLRREVPQNFSGGSTEYTPSGLPNDSGSQRNSTLATGANFRGLGSGATLTLLNGRRLAPSSDIGEFVDLSAIPVTAIDRIEALTDGASSTYGGDAVAGVLNIVLRDDFHGAETSIRYGSVTSGKMNDVRVGSTAGTAWGSGNILGTYEYSSRGNLVLADRPKIPVPTIASGTPISDEDQHDLLPEQEKHSYIISGSQKLWNKASLSFTGLYSKRRTNSRTVNAQTAREPLNKSPLIGDTTST